jgi:oxygen-independent coproporphyrinogen III oxidase
VRATRPLQDEGPSEPLSSLYVHVPFCRERCTYCAFTTVADERALHAPLVRALLDECGAHARAGWHGAAPLRTAYLGGGTPGLLALDDLETLLHGLRAQLAWTPDAELTLEVNPVNVTAETLAGWSALGITRLSIGVQTFRDDVLARLGRRHDSGMARRALELTHERWPHTWTADLLVGWAQQQLADLERDIEQLLRHEPPHVSVYGLTIEPATPLAQLAARGHDVLAAGSLLPAFDDTWSAALERAGLERYEVSNFAREGHRSRHNQAYWRNASYLGLGPGASSSVHPWRWTNRADLAGYLAAAAAGHGVRAMAERVQPFSRLIETVSCGLRTREGLAAADIDRRFGPAWREVLATGWAQLLERGVLSEEGGRIRVGARDVVRLDAILRELISTSDEPDRQTPARSSVEHSS